VTRWGVRASTLVGGSLLLVGALVAVLPFSADGRPCGSAFVSSREALRVDLRDSAADAADIAEQAREGSHQARCDRHGSLRRGSAVALLALAAVGLVGAVAAGASSEIASPERVGG